MLVTSINLGSNAPHQCAPEADGALKTAGEIIPGLTSSQEKEKELQPSVQTLKDVIQTHLSGSPTTTSGVAHAYCCCALPSHRLLPRHRDLPRRLSAKA